MTDTEIIKALECCTSTTEIGCELCPYSSTVNCLLRSTQDALELINRQKAEIEQLRTEKDKLIRTYRECQEAVLAEFAERLRDVRQIVTVQDMDGTSVRTVITERDLIRVEKEMRGERREGHRTHMAAQAAEEKEDRLI